MRSDATSPHRLLAPLGIGLAYCALATAALTLTRLSGGVALMWLANAPLIGGLCATPAQRWPMFVGGAWAGSAAAALIASPWPHWAPVFATINVGEGLVAAALLRRWGVDRSMLDSTRSIAAFVVATGLVAPVASALGGVTLASAILHIPFRATAFDWILGHGIGSVIFTPLAMQLTRCDIDWRAFHARRGTLKAIGASILIVSVTGFVFSQSLWPLLFLPMVPLLIGTFAFQRYGAAVGIIVVALVGGGLTTMGSGPVMLIHASEAARLQFFQFYLVVLFLTALPVAATLVQRDRLHAALSESEARYRLLADHATDIMLTLDPDGTIRYVSPAIRELGYFEPAELIGRNAATLIHPDDRDRVSAVHVEALIAPQRTFSVEYRAIKANGEIAWFETNQRAVRAQDGRVTAVVNVVRDLGVRKHREAELERAATTDPLTGLLNRAAFRRAAAEALTATRDGTRSTLAILDLDHFKAVNDTYGHATGDAALLVLADLLRDHLRAEDAIGRIGGEEFAILLACRPLPQAASICERLCALLAQRRIDTPGASFSITMSAGLVELRPGFGLDHAFSTADAALYRAKEAGRNRIALATDRLLG